MFSLLQKGKRRRTHIADCEKPTKQRFVETASHLRVSEPTVRKAIVDVQMKGRRFLELRDIPRVPVADFQRADCEWVLIAVLDHKSAAKVSKANDTYVRR